MNKQKQETTPVGVAVDKGFDVRHAVAVASRMDGPTDKLAALLHDAVEDGHVTVQDLWDADFPEEVVEAVQIVTRLPDEAYTDYIARIYASEHALAIALKLADLDANLSRMDTEHSSLTGRYRQAQSVLWGFHTTTASQSSPASALSSAPAPGGETD